MWSIYPFLRKVTAWITYQLSNAWVCKNFNFINILFFSPLDPCSDLKCSRLIRHIKVRELLSLFPHDFHCENSQAISWSFSESTPAELSHTPICSCLFRYSRRQLAHWISGYWLRQRRLLSLFPKSASKPFHTSSEEERFTPGSVIGSVLQEQCTLSVFFLRALWEFMMFKGDLL